MNYTYIMSALAAVLLLNASSFYAMNQNIPSFVRNVIDTNDFKIQSTCDEEENYTELEFYTKSGLFLGFSRYKIENNALELLLMEVEKKYRGNGLGKRIFHTTMYRLAKKYSQYDWVYWHIYSFDNKYKELCEFYRGVKAIVDETNKHGKINLKDAGYRG